MWRLLVPIFLTVVACFCMNDALFISNLPKKPHMRFKRPRTPPRTKIIGGSRAKNVDTPFQVSIRVDGRHSCGGSIYNERWIITAGHCIKQPDLKVDSITVLAGSKWLEVGGKTYKVQKKIAHKHQDIALLLLKDKLIFTPKIQPVVLVTRNIRDGESVVASGWGITDVKVDELSNYLQIIKLKTVPFEQCKKLFSQFKTINNGSICTLTRSGEGLCMGDSGGPLTIHENVLVGIVGFGIPCGVGYPDVFTGIYPNKKWIEETVKQNS